MAQIISLDKLKKLAKRPIAEGEYTSKFFWKFSDQFQDTVEDLTRGEMQMSMDEALHDAYRFMKNNFLRNNCPPIEYIDEGSSRAAYALDGGQCLKIALSEAGIDQNEAEATNMEKSGNLGVFPILYDYADDYTSILVECVTPCKYGDGAEIAKMLGVETKSSASQITGHISDLLQFAVEELPGDFDALFEMIADETQNPIWRELSMMIVDPANKAQQLLQKLAMYTIDNYRDFDIADVSSIKNWGFASRGGKIVPIVLDAGFSPSVREMWY